MQEWLKDKKNLPIVAAVGALVLVGAIVLILFEMGVLPPRPAATAIPAANGTPSRLTPSPLAASQTASAGRAFGTPLSPSTAARQTPGGVPLVGAKVPAPPLNAAKGPDPFKVPGYRPFRLTPFALNLLRVRNFLPAVSLQKYPPKDALVPPIKGKRPEFLTQTTPDVSSTMRMSGVITSDTSIKALLESNGVSTQVQPGDTVDGGKVLSIQPDGLILRTADSRLVRVPLSGTPTGGNSPYGGGGGGFPGGQFPGGGQPGADGAPPQ